MCKICQNSSVPPNLTLTDARAKLADIVSDAQYGGKVTIITRHGKAAAAVVPIALIPPETTESKKSSAPAVSASSNRKTRA
jgi:prevent-host-death family protein